MPTTLPRRLSHHFDAFGHHLNLSDFRRAGPGRACFTGPRALGIPPMIRLALISAVLSLPLVFPAMAQHPVPSPKSKQPTVVSKPSGPKMSGSVGIEIGAPT